MGLRTRAWTRNLIYVVDETAGAQRPVPSVHDAIRNDDETRGARAAVSSRKDSTAPRVRSARTYGAHHI